MILELQPRQPPQPPPSRKLKLSGGVQGTRQTLQIMAKLVRQGRENPAVRAQALQLVKPLSQKDYLGEAKKIHAFVRDHVRYVRDPKGVEPLHTAEQMLLQRQGDCDDKTVLVAAMLETIGHPTRIVAVGFAQGYCHVFPEVQIKGTWYTVETTEPWQFGQSLKKTPILRMVETV